MPQPMQGYGHTNAQQPQGFNYQNQPFQSQHTAPPRTRFQPHPPRNPHSNVRLSSVQIPVQHLCRSPDNFPSTSQFPSSTLLVETHSPEKCDHQNEVTDQVMKSCRNSEVEAQLSLNGDGAFILLLSLLYTFS